MAGNKRLFQEAMKRGSAHAWSARWTRAADEYRLALEQSPEDVAARTALAMACYRSGQLADALELYLGLWEAQPSNLVMLQRVAELRETLDQREAAAESYRLLAEIYSRRHSPEQAMEAWRKVVAFQPGVVHFWDSLMDAAAQVGSVAELLPGYLGVAQELALKGQFQEAIRVADRAQKLDPENQLVVPVLSAIRRGLEYSWRAASRGEETPVDELVRVIPQVPGFEPPPASPTPEAGLQEVSEPLPQQQPPRNAPPQSASNPTLVEAVEPAVDLGGTDVQDASLPPEPPAAASAPDDVGQDPEPCHPGGSEEDSPHWEDQLDLVPVPAPQAESALPVEPPLARNGAPSQVEDGATVEVTTWLEEEPAEAAAPRIDAEAAPSNITPEQEQTPPEMPAEEAESPPEMPTQKAEPPPAISTEEAESPPEVPAEIEESLPRAQAIGPGPVSWPSLLSEHELVSEMPAFSQQWIPETPERVYRRPPDEEAAPTGEKSAPAEEMPLAETLEMAWQLPTGVEISSPGEPVPQAVEPAEVDAPGKLIAPLEEAIPIEEPSLLGEAIPIEEPSLLEEAIPIEEPSLLEEAIPMEEHPFLEEAIPIEEPIPIEQPSILEEAIPMEEHPFLEEAIPMEEPIPIEQPSILEEAIPIEEPPLLEEAIPMEEHPFLEEHSLPEEPSLVAPDAEGSVLEDEGDVAPTPEPTLPAEPAAVEELVADSSDILAALRRRFPEAVLAVQPTADGIPTLWVSRDRAIDVLRHLKLQVERPYRTLLDLTVLDERGRANRQGQPDCTFTLVYHLLSHERNQDVRIKVPLQEASPSVRTTTDLWPSAGWYERETWDMFGIQIEGQPKLMRLLMPPQWRGHPLRKEHPINGLHEDAYSLSENPEQDQQIQPEPRPEEWGLGPRVDGESLTFLNLGAQHCGTHGPFRIALQLSGQEVVDAAAEIGFQHRGVEKMGERRSWHGFIPYTDRVDYLGGVLNELAYLLSVERLAGIRVPERAEVIRVMMAELSRISSHLAWLGSYAREIASLLPIPTMFADRERILDIMVAISGARLHPAWFRIGGVAGDLPEGWDQPVRDFVAGFPRRLVEYAKLVLKNRTFRARTEGIGKYTRDQAVEWGVTGPGLRACGSDWDLRKKRPYSGYDRFDFEVPVAQHGDCYSRTVVRLEEMRQSLRIVQQCLDNMPVGPHRADHPLATPPPRERAERDIDTLIPHFVGVSRGPNVPAGECFVGVETARGCSGYYLVSDGGAVSYRTRIRTPSFAHLQMLPLMARGHTSLDLVTVLGSIDMVPGEVDR